MTAKFRCKFCDDRPAMFGVAGYDNPNPGDKDGNVYAYNLYQCQHCGAVCKQDVWHNAGETWITVTGRIESKARSQ